MLSLALASVLYLEVTYLYSRLNETGKDEGQKVHAN